MRRTLAAACALAVALAVVVGPTTAATKRSAATLCVGGGGGCYSTIQAAVNAASSGDTIKINPGTYAGGVQVPKSLTIVGAGSTRTLIKGGGPVLTLGQAGASPATISLRGVTVTGGLNTGPDPSDVNNSEYAQARGGGILIPWGPDQPDGPSLVGANVTIVDSVIAGNRARPSASADWGIPCPDGVQCPGARAAGGGIESNGNLTLINTVVSDNQAITDTGFAGGGGLDVAQGSLTLRHSIVTRNKSVVTPPHGLRSWGSGINVDGGTGAITIADSQISDNVTSLTSTYPAGVDTRATGVALDFDESHVGPVTITNTKITGNSVAASSPNTGLVAGDVFYINATSPLTMRDSIVAGNRITATGAYVWWGGSIMEVHSPTTITDTQIVDNQTSITSLAGDASVYGTVATWSTDPVLFRDSLIARNTVQALANGGSALLQGAGIWNAGALNLVDTKVVNNVGRASGPSGTAQGGGIWNGLFPDAPLPVSLTLTDSLVAGNAVSGSPGLTVQGGGLFTGFPVALLHSVVAKNTPDQCYGC